MIFPKMYRCVGKLFSCAIFVAAYLQFDIIDGASMKAPSSKTRPTVTPQNRKLNVGIIDLRLDSGSEQCQCTKFYMCDTSNTVTTASDGNSYCEDAEQVCCINPITNSTSTATTSLKDVHYISTGEVACKCVPPEQCSPCERQLISSTGSSNGQCRSQEICCRYPILISDTNTEPLTTNPTPVNEEGASRSSDDDSCRCVPIEQCKMTNTDAQQNDGEGIIQPKLSSQQCSPFEICCADKYIVDTRDNPIQTVDSTCGNRQFDVFNLSFSASEDGNSNTFLGEFPWMASIMKVKDNTLVAGASIISPNFVLTAAHSIFNISMSSLKVRAGEHERNADKQDMPIQDRGIIKIVLHPLFHQKKLHNDLALVKVVQPFIYDYHIKPVCMPFIGENLNYDSKQCVATGWGKQPSGGLPYSKTLKKIELSLVDNENCQQQLRRTRLRDKFILDPSFICAQGSLGVDTCEGDGGGPLVCPLRSNKYQYVQVGVVSWGLSCGYDIPAVYASVQRNEQWINNELET